MSDFFSPNSKLVALADELHRRLHIQARNLLFEYRLSPTDESIRKMRGYVPCEVVEQLMRLYGSLIAREIWADQRAAMAPPALPAREGDIIVFTATAGHQVYGEQREFIGRVEKDARGLHAANYYDWAWKNPRIIERPAPAAASKQLPR